MLDYTKLIFTIILCICLGIVIYNIYENSSEESFNTQNVLNKETLTSGAGVTPVVSTATEAATAVNPPTTSTASSCGVQPYESDLSRSTVVASTNTEVLGQYSTGPMSDPESKRTDITSSTVGGITYPTLYTKNVDSPSKSCSVCEFNHSPSMPSDKCSEIGFHKNPKFTKLYLNKSSDITINGQKLGGNTCTIPTADNPNKFLDCGTDTTSFLGKIVERLKKNKIHIDQLISGQDAESADTTGNLLTMTTCEKPSQLSATPCSTWNNIGANCSPSLTQDFSILYPKCKYKYGKDDYKVLEDETYNKIKTFKEDYTCKQGKINDTYRNVNCAINRNIFPNSTPPINTCTTNTNTNTNTSGTCSSDST